jgi:hypothetical protein
LIESKKNLSKELLDGEGEISFTELSNEQVLQMVSLDIKTRNGGRNNMGYWGRYVSVAERKAQAAKHLKVAQKERQNFKPRRCQGTPDCPRHFGEEPGATTWKTTVTMKTGCREGGPMSATAP